MCCYSKPVHKPVSPTFSTSTLVVPDFPDFTDLPDFPDFIDLFPIDFTDCLRLIPVDFLLLRL